MFHYNINIIIINIINNLKLIKVKLNFELSIMLILLMQLQLSDKALANDIELNQEEMLMEQPLLLNIFNKQVGGMRVDNL